MKESYISAFDMLKIGVGPSSSHTMGPWLAMKRFSQFLRDEQILSRVNKLQVNAYGSLAKTGKGHGTDIAILLGLEDHDYRSIPVENIQLRSAEIEEEGRLKLGGEHWIDFNFNEDLQLLFTETLTFHLNGIRCIAQYEDAAGQMRECVREYFSIGGGFVLDSEQAEAQLAAEAGTGNQEESQDEEQVPYPFTTEKELLAWTAQQNCSIADIMRANEEALHGAEYLRNELNAVWQVMSEAIYHGISTEGTLPVMGVKRRAPELFLELCDHLPQSMEDWLNQLETSRININTLDRSLKFISCFAIAVNEQNACFGRVVTSPTNGSAGVIPALLTYYRVAHDNVGEKEIHDFLLTAAAIGALFKSGSTISAAMGGCQAEIGVSSAMAAAAFCSALGGTTSQACTAAEIAMEHHLGLTCDPIGGLVQIPCIERNAMGAIKAVTASYLGLNSKPNSMKVSLDMVIATMWETAQGMNLRYKETSEGGLAIKVPIAQADC